MTLPRRVDMPDAESITVPVKAALAIRRPAQDRHALEVMRPVRGGSREGHASELAARPFHVAVGQQCDHIAQPKPTGT